MYVDPRGGGYSWEFLVGVYHPVLQILTLFLTKKCHFPHPFSDLASIKLCHQWLTLERQHKGFLQSISNSHINLFFFSFFTWNWNDKYVCTLRSSCENHTWFQTKMGKLYIRFQAQTAQKLCPLGRHIPIWLIWESTPPPPGCRRIFRLL